MSIAIQKRSRGVSVKRPSRSSAAANATECTSTSSCPSNVSATSPKTRAEVVVGADVARGHERARHRRREVAHRLLDPLALERERELRALVRQPLRDRPRDRALVRDAEHERALSLEPSRHPRESRRPSYAARSRAAPAPDPRLAASRSRVRGAGFGPVAATRSSGRRPRVEAGTVRLLPPAGSRITVIVRLPLPPLARAPFRSLASASARRARRRERRLAQLPRAARARSGRGGRDAAARRSRRRASTHRYRIVLDGLAVSLPARRLAALARLAFARQLYPSVRYAPALDRSPAMIGATELTRGDGRRRRGHEDRGRRHRRRRAQPVPRRRPASPTRAGFPRGATSDTTPKVIVARVFPGPRAGARAGSRSTRRSRTARTSPASRPATPARARPPARPPRVTGLSGVAPRAWIGNYRVFTVPTPLGHVANTPEIVAAFEAAVADGMDVINFSGGGAETDPVNDALIDAVANVAAAGVVPVIAAGNDRDDYGLGSVGSPGTAPDAISVAAVSNTHDFAPAPTVDRGRRARVPAQIPLMRGAARAADSVGARDQTLVDVGSLVGTDGRRSTAASAAAAGDPKSAAARFRPRSLAGAIALVWRGICSFAAKADARARGRRAPAARRRQPPRRGERHPGAARAAGGDGRRPRRRAPARLHGVARRPHDDPHRHGRPRGRDRPRRHDHELLVGRPDELRPPAQARRLRAGRPDPLVDAAAHDAARRSPSSTARAWRRRTSPAPPRCCSSCTRSGRRRR